MADQELKISFEGCLPAEAAIFAQDLEKQLREAEPSTKISIDKARPDAQDFGSTLVIIFGTPAAIALVKALTAFLQRNSGASITITKAGTIIGKNLNSEDAAKIADAFSSRPR